MKQKVLNKVLKVSRELNKPSIHPEYGNYHHFSFIVIGDNIIGYGMNDTKSSTAPNPRFLGYGYIDNDEELKKAKVHSEINAYFKNKYYIDGAPFDVINVRLNKRGELRHSQPCECCLKFLKDMNVRRIYFSTENGFERN